MSFFFCLQIIGLRSCRVDSQIFQLKNLTHLDLSDNQIDRVPTQLGNLPLQTLNFSQNNLGKAPSWKWLKQPEIIASLHKINLTGNHLEYLPYPLIALRGLVDLNVSTNLLTQIPTAIKALHRLRNLNISSNKLESVPSAVGAMKLEVLDLSGNAFLEELNKVNATVNGAPTLLNLAARVVTKKRLFYARDAIPWILVDLLEQSPCCDCGSICFGAPIFRAAKHLELSNAKCVILDRQKQIPCDQVYCSRCMTTKMNSQTTRLRNRFLIG